MTEERLKFAERFTELADTLGYTGHGKQTGLARHYRKSQPAVKKWFDAEAQPDYEICLDMTKRAGWSFEYLMTGRGPKFIEDALPSQKMVLVYVNSEELLLLSQFREATDMGQQLISTAAKSAPKNESLTIASARNQS